MLVAIAFEKQHPRGGLLAHRAGVAGVAARGGVAVLMWALNDLV
ncbi:hypothetical protein AF72_08980 [Xylella taiwanensis]|nr:hypothetical protein AF72_08980 [Xylella taiwanensis]